MKCCDIEIHLADYLQNQLAWFTKLLVRRHLRTCASCRLQLNKFQQVLSLLETDLIEEPSPQTWDTMKENILAIAPLVTIPPVVFTPKSKLPMFQVAALATSLLLAAILGWLVLPAKSPVSKESSSSLFWTFFNSDLWDFSNFFQKFNSQKLSQITSAVEQEVQRRLQQELGLSKNDSSQLFTLMQNFGHEVKLYYDRYCEAMLSLSKAIEQRESANLQLAVQEVQQIRQIWSDSRWQFLRKVQYMLNPQQFARFLLFVERLPQELYTICSRLCAQTN